MEITITSKVRHGALLTAARKFGSIKEYAAYLGVSSHTLSGWINLKRQISLDKRGRFKPKKLRRVIRLLEKTTGQHVKDLFPEWFEKFKDAPRVVEFTREWKPVGIEHAQNVAGLLPSPDQVVEREELKQAVAVAMKSLTHRERRIISLRFGLNGAEEMKFDEIGKMFSISGGRASQIAATAIRKLGSSQHSEPLKEHVIEGELA